MKQNEKAKHTDWITQVKKDMKELNLNVTFVEMKTITKNKFKNTIVTAIHKKALEYLNDKKGSKTLETEHTELKMQNYLSPNNVVKIDEAKQIFRLRSHTISVKMNMKSKYANKMCYSCGLEEETQMHLLCCKILKTHEN